MGSYYNRPVVLHVEVSLDRVEWVRSSGDLGSVEAGLLFVDQHVSNGYWRIVDAGGNVHETGGAVEQRELVHVGVNERARRIREALEDHEGRG